MKVSHVAQPSPREVTWWLKLRLVRRVLVLPLLYRVLIANGVVILLGATIGTSLATQLRDTARPVILVLFVLTGLLASVAINWVLLKLMLFPLSQVREMMEQVQRGDLRRKAPVTGQDPDADALAKAFNTMVTALDDLGRSRASQILQAQEQERKRIARELHDETSQVLTTLLISLRMLENSVQSDDARARVAETRALAHQTLRAVRNLSIDLRPSALDEFGLVPALRSYVKWYQENTDIAVDLCVNGLKDRLPPEMETALYRIIQEALTNTAKHAGASAVSVMVVEDDGQIHASIHDNGRGFDAATLLRRPWQDRGLGLGGMIERASLLNGVVDIQSQVGESTTIEATIPFIRGQAPAAGGPVSEPSEKIHA